MLANTLNTNEIKNEAGVKQEFQRLSSGVRSTMFGLIAETPSLPHRLTIQHSETGSGLKARRRSVIRFDITSVSGVDPALTITDSAYVVLDRAIGASSNNTMATRVLANLMSFLATTGAGTTVLFDNTGNGAKTLIDGAL